MRFGIRFSSRPVQVRIGLKFLCCAGASFFTSSLPQLASAQDSVLKPNPLEQLASEVSNPRSLRQLQHGGKSQLAGARTTLQRELAQGAEALRVEKEALRTAMLRHQSLPSERVRQRERRKTDVLRRYQGRLDAARIDLVRADQMQDNCFSRAPSSGRPQFSDFDCQQLTQRLTDDAATLQTERHSMSLQVRAIDQERVPDSQPSGDPLRNPYGPRAKDWW